MNLTVTSSPHIRSKIRTDRVMLDVMIALVPALIVGVLNFGMRALLVTLVSMLAALISEWICGMLIYH